MSQTLLSLLCVLTIPTSSVLAGIQCGIHYCSGYGAYCCDLDDGDLGCCWTGYYVYSYWWFWLIWVFFLICVGFCILGCWRRRRNQMRYVVMTNSQYPSYGTTVHTSHQTVYPPGTVVAPPPGAVPTQPPSYVNKPPPYSYNA